MKSQEEFAKLAAEVGGAKQTATKLAELINGGKINQQGAIAALAGLVELLAGLVDDLVAAVKPELPKVAPPVAPPSVNTPKLPSVEKK